MRFLANLVDWRQVHSIFVLRQISLHTHKFQNSLMVIDKVIFIDKFINKWCDWWLNGVISWHKTKLQFANRESFVIACMSFTDLELSEWPLHGCCCCEGYCHEKLNPHHFLSIIIFTHFMTNHLLKCGERITTFFSIEWNLSSQSLFTILV